MVIRNIEDEGFRPYGKVLTQGYDVSELVTLLKPKDAPTDSVIYVPSVKEFEALPISKQIANEMYGQMPIQVGYCNGSNQRLDAVEYHRDSEVGIAGSDFVILVGKQQDIRDDFTYDSAKIEAFLVKEGTIFEMYATTLHYAPCSVENTPFRNIVILPKGTNGELEPKAEQSNDNQEANLLFAKNKWLIAHEEAKIDGAFVGIQGINIEI